MTIITLHCPHLFRFVKRVDNPTNYLLRPLIIAHFLLFSISVRRRLVIFFDLGRWHQRRSSRTCRWESQIRDSSPLQFTASFLSICGVFTGCGCSGLSQSSMLTYCVRIVINFDPHSPSSPQFRVFRRFSWFSHTHSWSFVQVCVQRKPPVSLLSRRVTINATRATSRNRILFSLKTPVS